MYDKKFTMDSDYREYTHYRDRPRGEFLTRGAALSSQQSVYFHQVFFLHIYLVLSPQAAAVGVAGGGRGVPEPVYGQVPAVAPQARGHAQYPGGGAGGVAAGQHAGHGPGPRLGRNISSEKIATPRNPTILRKSKLC